MNYRQYTPREIAAFLTARRESLIMNIKRGAEITGCSCWYSYVSYIESGSITTCERLTELYQYLIDLAIGIKRITAGKLGYDNITAECLLDIAKSIAFFLTKEEEDTRKIAAEMLHTAAASHARVRKYFP